MRDEVTGPFRERLSDIAPPNRGAVVGLAGVKGKFCELLVWLPFVAMSVAPYRYGQVKVALLALGCAVLSRFPKRGATNLRFAAGIALLLGLGMVGATVGLAEGNASAARVSVVFTIWPCLFGTLFHLIFTRFYNPILFASRLVVGLGFITSFSIMGVIFLVRTGKSAYISTVVDREVLVTTYSGFIQTNYQAVNSLVFLAPVVAVFMVLKMPGMPRSLAIVSGLSAIGATAISGRQALTAVSVIVPLAVMIGARTAKQFRFCRMRLRWSFFARSFLLALAVVGSIFLNKSGLSVSSSFRKIAATVFTDDGGEVRSVQLPKLLDEGMTSPIFGKGTGASVPGYVRDPLNPWAYELSYALLFLNFGLFGLLILGGWGGAFLAKLLRRSAPEYSLSARLAFLSGALGFSIATISNPYPFKVDGIWPLILVSAVAHHFRPQRIGFPHHERLAPYEKQLLEHKTYNFNRVL